MKVRKYFRQKSVQFNATLWLFFAISAAQATVTETTLDNGLKVIIKEDHRAPIVVSQIWYKVGSSYEHNGITGISHMLEHMMFKGTEKLAPGEFSKIIAEHGGRENAFTGRDYTAYFQTLEKSRLPISFELEAERMRNLKLDNAEFLKEREVVAEERRMRTEDNPTSKTYEQFTATAYQTSPYHHPVIGWMDDIHHYTLDDLQQWYQKWYAPNNAILVVAGDVEPGEVIALAKEHFGKLEPSENLNPPKPQKEVEQLGQRTLTVKLPAEIPYLLMGYPVPTVATTDIAWEPYALEVLASVLDGGASSRLPREIVRGSKIASSTGAGYDLYDRLDTLFLFDGLPAAGHTIEEVQAALQEQIKRSQETLVTKEELQRVKAQVVAGKIFGRDSVFYQAMQIGNLETIGLEWEEMDRYTDKIRAVTPEQVQQVAKKYLVSDKLTVAYLDPLPLDMKQPHSASSNAGGRHAH